jgi:undecaprenyl-diphosphatase
MSEQGESFASNMAPLQDVSRNTKAPLNRRHAQASSSLILLVAASLFALIARRVHTKRAEPFDQRTRDWIQHHRIAVLDVATRPVTLLSIPLVVAGATAAVVWRLQQDGRKHAAFAAAVTPFVAATAGQSFTTFLSQRNPPDKGDAPGGEVTEPSFPSGHTTGVTAEALAIAYLLDREDLATPALLGLLLAWPVVVGVSRVYRDRHWISDILGGWAAGTGVAAMAALLYHRIARAEAAGG